MPTLNTFINVNYDVNFSDVDKVLLETEGVIEKHQFDTALCFQVYCEKFSICLRLLSHVNAQNTTLKRRVVYDANFDVTDGTGCCRYDNHRCLQWRKTVGIMVTLGFQGATYRRN